VELWEHKLTGQTYALKRLNKGLVSREGMQQRVLTEKLVLNMVDSPFIVALYETYNEPYELFFLMEAALGGELHSTYKRRRLYGSEEHTRYYAACVTFALRHLHERFIIYRDMKPENVLLSARGHAKVADFGLSKLVIGKTFSICGSPDYFAPELVAQTGHTLALDWWQLGVLVFELLSGQPPFQSDSTFATYLKVMDGIDKITFPAAIRGYAASLVRALLEQDPAERLPMLPGGFANLQGHGWFAGFDWDALESLQLQPPFVPEVANARDLANFPVEEIPLTKLPYEDDGSGWDDHFESA
jgi:serine/threonine protein kinase